MPVDLKKDDMGDVVKDFYKSDAPQFKGKSKKKRREMAIAAKLSAESALHFQEAERSWHKGYDSGDKTVPRRKALDRAEYFDNRGENERAHKIRRIAISKDHGETHEARRKAKNIKISDKVGKLRPASIDDKRGAVSGDVQKKLTDSFDHKIDPKKFKKDKRDAKIGNLARKTTNPGEKSNAEKFSKGPKLFGESPSILKVRGKRNTYMGASGDHRRDEHGHIVADFYNKKPAPTGDKNKKTSYKDKPKRDLVARRARLKAKREKREAKQAAAVNEGKLDKVMDTVRKYTSGKKPERKAQKAMDAGARAKRLLQRKEYASKVSGSTDNVPDNIRDHKIW